MRLPHSSSAVPALRHEFQPGLWLDSRRALWIARERLLVVADLHWGYAVSHRARGNLVPLWGDAQLERTLRELVAEYLPAEMIWLGDVVHAAEGAAAAETFIRDAPVPVTLIAGNHDRRWRGAGVASVARGRFHFHHGDARLNPPAGTEIEVIGHHHPAVTCGDHAGSRVKLPALVAGRSRLILPAFSPWAAGTPWNHQLASGDILWAITPRRIFAAARATSESPQAV